MIKLRESTSNKRGKRKDNINKELPNLVYDMVKQGWIGPILMVNQTSCVYKNVKKISIAKMITLQLGKEQALHVDRPKNLTR